MQLGEVIRKYRKMKNMTQEKMADRLGVTASAVNKWENGNSFPDITLLAPIARLLDISLDTLLTFQEKLTTEEINEIICKADVILKEKSYDEALWWAKKKLEQYPSCEQLSCNIALFFDGQRIIKEIPNAEKYDEYLCSLYIRAVESNDETIRCRAADALFGFYMRKKEYDRAEEYLEYFSNQDPIRKIKQAQLYGVTGRIREAYKAYEGFLFANFQTISGALHGMYMLALQEKDMKRAHMFVAKQEEMAKCFEMGRYYEVSGRLEIATLEKDAATVIATMKDMLSSVEQIGSFSKAPLYEHMDFKEIKKEVLEEVKSNLLNGFREEESYGFLKNDKDWRELVK